MKNKALVIAGFGSALAIAAVSALSFVSANETTAVATTATTQTQTHQGFFQKAGGKKIGRGDQHNVMMMGAPMAGKVMMKFGMGNEAMQTAVKNNDYNAFVAAWNADTNKPSEATVPTQEQFTKMVEMEQKHTPIQ